MSTPVSPTEGASSSKPFRGPWQPPLDTNPWKPFSRSQSRDGKSKKGSKSKSKSKSRSRRKSSTESSHEMEPMQSTTQSSDQITSQAAEQSTSRRTRLGTGDEIEPAVKHSETSDRDDHVQFVQQQRHEAEDTKQTRSKEAKRGRSRDKDRDDGSRDSSCCALM